MYRIPLNSSYLFFSSFLKAQSNVVSRAGGFFTLPFFLISVWSELLVPQNGYTHDISISVFHCSLYLTRMEYIGLVENGNCMVISHWSHSNLSLIALPYWSRNMCNGCPWELSVPTKAHPNPTPRTILGVKKNLQIIP